MTSEEVELLKAILAELKQVKPCYRQQERKVEPWTRRKRAIVLFLSSAFGIFVFWTVNLMLHAPPPPI